MNKKNIEVNHCIECAGFANVWWLKCGLIPNGANGNSPLWTTEHDWDSFLGRFRGNCWVCVIASWVYWVSKHGQVEYLL